MKDLFDEDGPDLESEQEETQSVLIEIEDDGEGKYTDPGFVKVWDPDKEEWIPKRTKRMFKG